MSAPEVPQISDGKQGLRNPILKCLNILTSSAPRRYHYIDDDISVKGVSMDHALENDGSPLGGFTGAGFEQGSISMQYDTADETEIVPGFVMLLNKGLGDRYYRVTDGGIAAKRNDIKRGKIPVTRLYNPVSVLLQGALGNYYTKSVANSGAIADIDPDFQNFRSGATEGYTAVQSDGSALPTGVTINASTGLISIDYNTVLDGSYEIVVTATDTLSGYRTRSGFATLALTVT